MNPALQYRACLLVTGVKTTACSVNTTFASLSASITSTQQKGGRWQMLTSHQYGVMTTGPRAPAATCGTRLREELERQEGDEV